MKTRKSTIFKNLYRLDSCWLIDLVVLKSNDSEIIKQDDIYQILDFGLQQLEQKCMSTEFDYYFTGIAFLHFGNRGVELTIWHFGKWGNTAEYYCVTWYCYNRDFRNMELLDNAEPHFSQYEVNHIANLLPQINEIITNANCKEEFRKKFLTEIEF